MEDFIGLSDKQLLEIEMKSLLITARELCKNDGYMGKRQLIDDLRKRAQDIKVKLDNWQEV